MNQQRRDMLRFSAVMGLAVAAGLIKPEEARAAQEWNKAAFATRSVADTVKALGGTSASPSDQVVLSVPDIAENGAVVPVVVAPVTGLAGTCVWYELRVVSPGRAVRPPSLLT